MVLKRSSVLLLIGMIILSMVLPSLEAIAEEGENSVDTSQPSEEAEVSSEEVDEVKVVEADEVEGEVVEETTPTETTESEETIVDEDTNIRSETEVESVVEETEEEPAGEEVNLDEVEAEQVADEVEGSLMSIMPMAIPTPGHYTIDPNAIVVPSKIEGVSTNAHTLSELVWSNGDIVYAAIKSTHALGHMVVNGVTTTAMDQYNAKINIFVDGVEYEPDGLKGNTDASHWTVFKFNLADLNLDDSGRYTFLCEGV